MMLLTLAKAKILESEGLVVDHLFNRETGELEGYRILDSNNFHWIVPADRVEEVK